MANERELPLYEWANLHMTPLERWIVTCGAFATPAEAHRLSVFFDVWAKEVRDGE